MSRRLERVRSAAILSRTPTRTPVARPGTCATEGPRPSVRMDDGSIVYAQCLGERPAVGQRVTVEFWGSGAFVTGVYGGAVRLLAKASQYQDQEDVTDEEDMYDLHATVAILSPGRQVRVTVQVYVEISDADSGAELKVTDENGDPIGDTGRCARLYVPVDAGKIMLHGFVTDVPDPGERTYQVTLACVDAGTVTAKCENTRAEMLVEDIGPAAEDSS